MNEPLPVRVRISEEPDVAMARKYVREVARQAGLAQAAMEALATAVSEIAQNIVVHAGRGEISIWVIYEPGRSGVAAAAADQGPGIVDPQQALDDGFSTANSLGLGLPSAKRLVDEFNIVSAAGKGTTIILKKWNS